MGHVDFTDWAVQDLVLPYKGKQYRVPAPSVRRAPLILASALRGEINLGYARDETGAPITEVPEEVQELLDTIGDTHPGLTDEVYAQMVADDLPVVTIDRMAYYAVFYWARGREYADRLAALMWTPRELPEEEQPAPKD
ncbi:DUF7426 family protein [Microbacterium luteum]|uniref:DUF7426 family protein n=1 Tax=Microbacterium luteum TaxID=2782167 RepID=UPI0018886AA1|nr:hypothetical protein [Microbacterium luteum]